MLFILFYFSLFYFVLFHFILSCIMYKIDDNKKKKMGLWYKYFNLCCCISGLFLNRLSWLVWHGLTELAFYSIVFGWKGRRLGWFVLDWLGREV